MESALYLIPVTLGDTSPSKVLPDYNFEVIKDIRHFIVESRKSAVRFLISIDKDFPVDECSFTELSEHTDIKETQHILAPLENGKSMGVISDAGCPCIGDPGAIAVALAQKKNLRIVPLVGPNSMLLALMSSGFNGQNFAFNGYLPVKNGERESKIRQLESKAYKDDQTQLFIEAPYRNDKMMDSLLKTLRPDTKLCIAAGLTTSQEFSKVKTVAEWKKSTRPAFNKIPAIFLIYR